LLYNEEAYLLVIEKIRKRRLLGQIYFSEEKYFPNSIKISLNKIEKSFSFILLEFSKYKTVFLGLLHKLILANHILLRKIASYSTKKE